MHFYTAGNTIDKIKEETEHNFMRVDEKPHNTLTRTIRKHDIRDDINFRNMIFSLAQQGVITTFNKWMVALDCCATNSVCPYEELLINITWERNNMICGGSHVVTTTKKGDLILKGYDRFNNHKTVKISGVYIDPASPYTILSSTNMTNLHGYEIMQRCKVMALANSSGDYLLFDKTYETKNGFLSCLVVDAMEANISYGHQATAEASMDEPPEDNYMSPSHTKQSNKHNIQIKQKKSTKNIIDDHYMCPGTAKQKTTARRRLEYKEATTTKIPRSIGKTKINTSHNKELKRKRHERVNKSDIDNHIKYTETKNFINGINNDMTNLKEMQHLLWIADSGATVHITNAVGGFTDISRQQNNTLTYANQNKEKCTISGKWKGRNSDSE